MYNWNDIQLLFVSDASEGCMQRRRGRSKFICYVLFNASMQKTGVMAQW